MFSAYGKTTLHTPHPESRVMYLKLLTANPISLIMVNAIYMVMEFI
jgi:hypothetical protein